MKKLLIVLCVWAASFGYGWAAVDVNTADQAGLESIKGIGPVRAKAIIDERAAHGPFKDPVDLASRVKGFGAKAVDRLREAGLTIGTAKPPQSPKPNAVSDTAAKK